MLITFNSYYSELSCDTYLINEAANKDAAANLDAQNNATASELAAYSATQGTTVAGFPITTTNVAIVCAVVVAVIIGFVAIKKMGKN